MNAGAPNDTIALTLPVWIAKSGDACDDEYLEWLRGKFAAAGWGPGRAREVKGLIAVSMRIACPVPPAGLTKRKTAALEAGETVFRDTGLAATEIADILIKAMGLRRGQVVKLYVERVYGPAACVDITIESL
jgi:hypothetical protein